MSKRRVDGDEHLNPALREEVQSLRGAIAGQIEKKFKGQPEWLEVIPCESRPAYLFRDKRTGRSVEIGLCDSHGALDVIKAFFGEE